METKRMKMFPLFISMVFWISLFSFVASDVPSNITCTVEMKGLATLKFSICQKEVYSNWCYAGSVLGKYQTEFFKEYDPENFQADDPCSGHKTSCGYLRFLTEICGAPYSVCHEGEERTQIMGMWIKQFLRELSRNVGRFENNSLDMKTGECDNILEEFLNKDEVAVWRAITAHQHWEPYERSGKVVGILTNITAPEFGVLVDQEGKRLGKYSNLRMTSSYPSEWTYCSWQLTKDLLYSSKQLFNILPKFFRCDGKCNTNNGDDQEWVSDTHFYRDENTDTGEIKHEEYMADLIAGEGFEGIFSCYWKAGYELEDVDWTDLYKAKKGLCQPFETLIQNCSIPIGKCLGDVAIREVVMAEFLKDTVMRNERTKSIAQRVKWMALDYGNFTFEDCEIFGGNLASPTPSNIVQIVFITLITFGFVI